MVRFDYRSCLAACQAVESEVMQLRWGGMGWLEIVNNLVIWITMEVAKGAEVKEK